MPRLTQKQMDSFQKDGFLSLGKILEDEEIETLRREYDRLLGEDTGRELSQLRQITQSCERSIIIRRLIHDDRILDPIESLIGPNIILYQDQILYKPPRSKQSRIYWHQDNAYWRCRPANQISLWLTLDDVVQENGAMQFIKRSHLELLPHQHPEGQDVLLEAIGVRDEDAVVENLPAGGATLHHCQTLHCSRPNTTARPRRALAMHFMTPGTVRKTSIEPGEEHLETIFQVDFHHPALRLKI